jgi:hypothetical protein
MIIERYVLNEGQLEPYAQHTSLNAVKGDLNLTIGAFE